VHLRPVANRTCFYNLYIESAWARRHIYIWICGESDWNRWSQPKRRVQIWKEIVEYTRILVVLEWWKCLS